MLATLGFEQDVIVTVPNARKLVESGMFFAGDGEGLEEFESIQDQVLQCLKRKYEDCSDAFIRNCLRTGIQFPVLFYMTENGLYRSINGHHRLSIAYHHSVPFPAIFASTYERADAHDPEYRDVLMWSTDRRERGVSLSW